MWAAIPQVVKKKSRLRDRFRKDGKVLNPAYFLSTCVVCWADTRGTGRKPTRTNKYCRECSKEERWPKGMTRGGGYMHNFHPCLCSERCWKRFQTQRIHNLDLNPWKQRRNAYSLTFWPWGVHSYTKGETMCSYDDIMVCLTNMNMTWMWYLLLLT